jgi:acetyltransferase EpsM
MKKIIIVGAGEQGRVILDYVSQLEDCEVEGFLDDSLEEEINGVPILGKVKDARFDSEKNYFVAFGNNSLRGKIIEEIKKQGGKLETIVNPSAIISKTAEIGEGTSVGAGAIICNDSKIGEGVIIDTGAIIEHDNEIGNYVNVSPGSVTMGGVKIGKYSWISGGVKIGEDLEIGKNSVIGLGSVVLKNISDNVVAYGVPAEIKRKNNQ